MSGISFYGFYVTQNIIDQATIGGGRWNDTPVAPCI